MSSTYAQIDENRIVLNIISADSTYIAERTSLGETYVQVTNPRNPARIGATHNTTLDMFVPLPPSVESGWNWEIVNTESDGDGGTINNYSWVFTPSNPVNTQTEGSVYVAEYNAYIVPPEDDSWVFNESELRWESPS